MKTKGYFLTILSAVIFGFTPILAKITYSMGEQWNYNGLFSTFICNTNLIFNYDVSFIIKRDYLKLLKYV